MNRRNPAPVAWAESPAPERQKMIPIYTPTPDRPVNAILLGDRITGAYVHYFDGRDRPCTAPAASCHGCVTAIDRRWKGFIAAWDPARGRWCIVQVTREAYDKCPALAEYAGRLRGYRIRLERQGRAANSRVGCKLSMPTHDQSHLPPAFDIKEALECVWYTSRREGAPVRGDQAEADELAQQVLDHAPLFGLEGV